MSTQNMYFAAKIRDIAEICYKCWENWSNVLKKSIEYFLQLFSVIIIVSVQ